MFGGAEKRSECVASTAPTTLAQVKNEKMIKLN